MTDPLQVVERVLQIVEESRTTSTYKLAVLLGLIDLCMEADARGLPPQVVTTQQLAARVLALYWPQIRRWTGPSTDRLAETDQVLRQNRRSRLPTGELRNPATILRLAAELRHTADGTLSVGAGIERVRRQLPEAYDAVLLDVEWTLITMPLPKLQRIAGQDLELLYTIDWDDRRNLPSRRAFKESRAGRSAAFDNRIQFVDPAVPLAFARLSGLLRPFIEQRWVQLVAQMNGLEDARLHAFLFGASRVDLGPVREPLLAAQRGRCFYCGSRTAEPEVDHFLPWSRTDDNGLCNLVAACGACNGSKRDHLAALPHLDRWLGRPPETLRGLAAETGWAVGATRTLGLARTLYLGLPAETRLWSKGRTGFEAVDPAAVRRRLVG